MVLMMILSKFAWTNSSNNSALFMRRAALSVNNKGVAMRILPPVELSASSSIRNINDNQIRKRSLSFYPHQPPSPPDKHGNRGGYGYGGSNPSSSSSLLRAYPTYAVFGENCLLSVKMLPPMFRVHPNSNTLMLDSNKKGRILLEWTPRVANGRLSRDKESQLRFGLSAEEVGLMLDQLPANIVEFSRRPTLPSGGGGGGQSEFGAITTDVPDKVLRITPGEGGSVSFLIDHELNGVSVPPPPPVSNSATTQIAGPLLVVAQLGEFTVIKELLRSSIPVLVGWSTMAEIAMQRSFENMHNNNHGGGGYGGGGEHTF